MTRRQFAQVTAGAVLSSRAPAAPSRARPNIIVILADDMGYSDLGCYGSEIATPNLDGLAKRGVRFANFYNCARCCPTRASLLTGLYAHQAGVGHMMANRGRPAYQGDLNRNCVTIAEALRDAGYRTVISGKWHVTPVGPAKHNWPLQRGFERFYGTIHGGGSFYDPVTLVSGNESVEVTDPEYYYTDAITEHALRFIEDFEKSDSPYFLYVAYTAPHYPLHVPAGDAARYRGPYKSGWDQLRIERYRRLRELGLADSRWRLPSREDSLPPWAEQPALWKDVPHKEWQTRRMEVYAAMVERMDRNIGRILGRIRQQGQDENTLILFMSDNGGEAQELRMVPGRPRPLHVPETTVDGKPVQLGNDPRYLPGPPDTYQSIGANWAYSSNTPFRLYKRWAHEGGCATPLIASWPAVINKGRGGIRQEPAHVIDIMATCLEVARASYPQTYHGQRITPVEGRSLKPVLEGRLTEAERPIFFEHEGNRAVRQGRWKLVSQWPGRWELYDLDEDRTETTDLSTKHPDRASALLAEYERWARRVGAATPDELSPASKQG